MAYTLDGTLAEWTGTDRLDRPGTSPMGYQVFGRVKGETLRLCSSSTNGHRRCYHFLAQH